MRRIWRDQSGAEIVEFGLVILPLLGFVFLIIDVSWIVFAKSSIQHAARQGVRYAVTGQTLSGMGQDASIKTVVEQNSFGFLTALDDPKIAINYYDPNSLTATNLNAAGNVVEVSVNGVAVSSLGPILRSGTPIQISARSSDVVEGSPGGIPPAR